MRRVLLNAPEGTVLDDPRLTRHLMGRLLELAEDGVDILGEQNPFAPRALPIKVHFSTIESGEMIRLLEERYGVHLLRGTDGTVSLSPAPGTTFEDIDYVQGAVCDLLCR